MDGAGVGPEDLDLAGVYDDSPGDGADPARRPGCVPGDDLRPSCTTGSTARLAARTPRAASCPPGRPEPRAACTSWSRPCCSSRAGRGPPGPGRPVRARDRLRDGPVPLLGDGQRRVEAGR
ncbi:hypothetical protein HBB16_15850 [Pseudonocardia sp. MCCB 268]|nr:hypothetical protein [Pseudonocardia cytotoxica]